MIFELRPQIAEYLLLVRTIFTRLVPVADLDRYQDTNYNQQNLPNRIRQMRPHFAGQKEGASNLAEDEEHGVSC